MTRTIVYIQKIHRRGWFGIPFAVPKLRVAHVDERSWRRMKGRPFSVYDMLTGPLPADPDQAGPMASRATDSISLSRFSWLTRVAPGS